ncbi:MAG: TlpA family protein disulfide reductase [Planctomycetota bacterium]|nr:MAG: TlpA family protein disulfide reductase [Planctomycetota bacterium]
MYLNKIKWITILLIIITGTCGAYAQKETDTTNKPTFKSVDELLLHYNNKIKEALRTLEIKRLASLENYLERAPESERRRVLMNMLKTADFLRQYDKVISTSGTILKNYAKDPDKWKVLNARFEALMNSGRLDQAYQEWEKACGNVNLQNWQSVFETGMNISDRFIEARQVDKTKAIYNTLRKKLTFVGDLEMLLKMKEQQLFWVGRTAPPIMGKDLDGKKVDWADYRGKVVLLEFWATWCGPCIAQMPQIKNVHEQFHPQGFEIIGINLDYTIDALKNFIKQNQIPWRQLFDSQSYSSPNAISYNVTSIPASFLIGPDGKIVMSGDPTFGWERVVSRLLAKAAAANK